MRKLLLVAIMLCCRLFATAQEYVAFPTDSVSWRYRFYNIDYSTQIFDLVYLMNGTDTFLNGFTYHQLFTRVNSSSGPVGYNPPVQTVRANHPDNYYGSIRESDKKIYLFSGLTDQLLYDFNARVGDSIPGYLSKVKVVEIDSMFLSGSYHKRYLTSKSNYYVLEGVGSSMGLIPDLNDGLGDVVFYCFKYNNEIFVPDTTYPCTDIYDINSEKIGNVDYNSRTILYPNPAHNNLYIKNESNELATICIYDMYGELLLNEIIHHDAQIDVSNWGKGIYFVKVTGDAGEIEIHKLIID